MTRNATKIEERRHVEMFLRSASIQAEVEDSERPDFILIMDGTRIGLEVTKLTSEALKESQENCKRHVETKLQEFLKTRARPLTVQIVLRENLTLFSREPKAMKPFLEKIRSYIERRLAEPGPVAVGIRDRADLSALGLTEVAVLSITEAEPGEQPLVSVSPTIMHYGGDSSLIEMALEDKERRLAEYQRNAKTMRQWLLLVTHDDLSQPITAETISATLRLKTGFEKVYVLDIVLGVVKELQTFPILGSSPSEEPQH